VATENQKSGWFIKDVRRAAHRLEEWTSPRSVGRGQQDQHSVDRGKGGSAGETATKSSDSRK
jgi:hypothetical protein